LSNSLQTPGRLKVDPKLLAQLSPEERARVEHEVAELERIYDVDALQRLRPNCSEQDRYMASTTRTTAGFAGNQAGKTTALVGKALIQHAPLDRLPARLHRYKRFGFGREPVQGRIVNPGAKLLKSGILPAFRQWTPRYMLRDGSFDRSWHSQDQILEFVDPYGFIDFLTYEQELDKFGSVQRHYVGYDEPPPREIRDEGLARLMRFDGFEMFAMTPLKANTGWVRRELWRKREAADITVCKWSIHDNKALSPAAVAYFLSQLPNDLWRKAREFGDFVDIGGLIYPGFEDALVKGCPPDPATPTARTSSCSSASRACATTSSRSTRASATRRSSGSASTVTTARWSSTSSCCSRRSSRTTPRRSAPATACGGSPRPTSPS
jgi:phage terminase large subunit-like protein